MVRLGFLRIRTEVRQVLVPAVVSDSGSMLSAMESKQNSIAFHNGAESAQWAAATGGVYFHDSNDFLNTRRGGSCQRRLLGR